MVTNDETLEMIVSSLVTFLTVHLSFYEAPSLIFSFYGIKTVFLQGGPH